MSKFKNCFTALLILWTNVLFGQCSTTINTFPYNESFETGTGYWVSGGTNNDWAWGSPSKTVINAAGAGSKCWIVGGLTASFYNYGERSWVESPCFDFTLLNRPYVSFLIFWESERSYDGGNFQYSSDNGLTWKTIGSVNGNSTCTDQNWYNISSVINLNNLVNNTSGWSGNIQSSSGSCSGGGGSGGWKLSTHCLSELANKPLVKFRFTFGSGTTCNDFDGFAFDNITIGPAPISAVDFLSSCAGGNQLNFNDASPDCHNNWQWNFGDTLSPSNSGSGKNTSHQYSAGGNYLVTLQVSGSCVNDTTISKSIKVLEAKSTKSKVSCSGGNNGSAQVIVTNPSALISYDWSHDTTINGPVANNLPTGLYNVIVSDPGACSLTTSIEIEYGPDAFPYINLGNDTVVCPGKQVTLYPGKFNRYIWQDNSNDSIYIVEKAGKYSVSIVNSAGCGASDSLNVVEDCLTDIVVPNAFTPNGDNLNDIFFVDGSITADFEIDIFNRWGELIFHSDNRSEAWDGTYKGNPVQEGFYNYLIKYNVYAKENLRKGSIYLFR